jgi:serine/threonine protein kinase
MATVYLAQDIRHARPVAVKVLRPELAAVIGAERFLAEIKLTANLQHPHILPLFDSGEADGYLFYVMPYVEGETLRDRLTREKQLPVADAIRDRHVPRHAEFAEALRDKSYSTGATTAAAPTEGTVDSAQRMRNGHL